MCDVRPLIILTWPLRRLPEFSAKNLGPLWKRTESAASSLQKNYFFPNVIAAMTPCRAFHRTGPPVITLWMEPVQPIRLSVNMKLLDYSEVSDGLLVFVVEATVLSEAGPKQIADLVSRLRRAFSTWPESLFHQVQLGDDQPRFNPSLAVDSKERGVQLHRHWVELLAPLKPGEHYDNPHYEQIPCLLFLPLTRPWSLQPEECKRTSKPS